MKNRIENNIEIMKWVQKGFELGMFTENGELNNEIAKQAIALHKTAINTFLEEKQNIRREKLRSYWRKWNKKHRELKETEQIEQLKKDLDKENNK